jgi:hypothetical protein
MANPLTTPFRPHLVAEVITQLERTRHILTEGEKRRLITIAVRELLKTRLSEYEIIRRIFPEPERGDRLAQTQRRFEIGIVHEVIEHYDAQRLRQEEDRQTYLERVVPELLNAGYSESELFKIIWPSIQYMTPREIEIVNRIIRLRTGNDAPDQTEAERLISGIGPVTNKYLKYKSKYLQLKNKIFNL